MSKTNIKPASARWGRYPARGAVGYLGKPKIVTPKKHLAAISFVPAGAGAYHVLIDLENRGGSIMPFKFEGVDGDDVELDGCTKHVVTYELSEGAKSVRVILGKGEEIVIAEEATPDGDSFS